MAKRATKVLPARKPAGRDGDDSLLVRSAESFGRVVGSLQRQMRGTAKRASTMAEDAMDALPEIPSVREVFGDQRSTVSRGTSTRKSAASRSASPRRSSGSRVSAGARKSASTRQRGGSRKRAGARKRSAERKRAASHK